MYDEEAKIREKAMMLVKQKLVTKLKDLEVSEEQHIELEKELLEDLEETIQAQLLTYRKFLQNDDEHHEENSESVETTTWTAMMIQIYLSFTGVEKTAVR